MRCSQRLPNVCKDDKNAKNDRDWSSAEDVRKRNDQNVCEAQSDHIHTGKKGELLLIKVKLGTQ